MDKKSLTKTKIEENITKIFELIAMLLILGCLVSVLTGCISWLS